MLRWTPVVSRAVVELLGEDLFIPAFGWVTGGRASVAAVELTAISPASWRAGHCHHEPATWSVGRCRGDPGVS